MASTASVKGPLKDRANARRGPRSGPDRASQRLSGRHDLTAIIMAAMAAHVMRALQLTAILAFRMRLMRQCLVTPPHAPT